MYGAEIILKTGKKWCEKSLTKILTECIKKQNFVVESAFEICTTELTEENKNQLFFRH